MEEKESKLFLFWKTYFYYQWNPTGFLEYDCSVLGTVERWANYNSTLMSMHIISISTHDSPVDQILSPPFIVHSVI